jgi:hypothetical protein
LIFNLNEKRKAKLSAFCYCEHNKIFSLLNIIAPIVVIAFVLRSFSVAGKYEATTTFRLLRSTSFYSVVTMIKQWTASLYSVTLAVTNFV